MPIRMIDILDNQRISLNTTARSKKSLFQLLSELLEHKEQQTDSHAIMNCLMQREKLGSTAVGHGIAIPHGRMESLTQPIACFVRLNEGLNMDAPDEQNVDLIFGLIVPQDNTNEHLNLLAYVAKIFDNQSSCQTLRDLSSKDSVYDFFLQQDENI